MRIIQYLANDEEPAAWRKSRSNLSFRQARLTSHIESGKSDP
jgi:hypothetical protein